MIGKFNILGETYKKGKKIIWNSLNRNQKTKLILCFIICFFFIELFWRMMFEFLIAYMQIRDVLVLN
ncbi:MAG TPA: DUF4282 domain-containing protein [Campylobacterales bacterium]|nr:DUF4282 domain-containing protein [Campylobacterales bacterium]HIP59081.1 DUF4282 domain-containing protein [Campylobacterales bacterium]